MHRQSCKIHQKLNEMNTRIALTPPKRPPLGQCTGCNTKVGGEGRRLALCKDCGYQACGSCEPHYSRGTCLPLYPRGPQPFSYRPLGVIGPGLDSSAGASGAVRPLVGLKPTSRQHGVGWGLTTV